MSRSLGGTSLTSWSPISISPEVASSSPAIIRNVVVLPQPDGPTSTINSRSAISRSIPCTAGVLSNILTTLRSATCAIFTSFFDRLLPPCGAARGLVIQATRPDQQPLGGSAARCALFSPALVRLQCYIVCSRAENPRVVGTRTAMPFEFVGIAAQRIGFAQIADNSAPFAGVDHRQHLLACFAKTIERGAQIVSGRQKSGRRRDQIADRFRFFAIVETMRFRRIDDAGQAALVIDDKYLLGASGRITPVQLVKRQGCRNHGRIKSAWIQPTSSGLRIPRPRKWKRQVAKEYPNQWRTPNDAVTTPTMTPIVAEKLPVVSSTSMIIVIGAPTIAAATAPMPTSA